MENKNPLLQQTRQAIDAKVPAELKNTYQRIVLAGEKFMYSQQTHRMMLQQMQSNPNPAEAAGEGVAKLFAILLKESKGTLNMKAAAFAMTALLCEALGFMEDAGKVQVNEQLLSQATQEMGSAMLQIIGITPQKLQSMVGQNGSQAGAQPVAQPQPVGIMANVQGA